MRSFFQTFKQRNILFASRIAGKKLSASVPLLFAATFALTGCQNETIIYVDENGNHIENVELNEGEGFLKINISNTSANSRAVRPVGSSAAANNVNVVKIYAFKGDNNASENNDYKFDTSVGASGVGDVSGSNGVITITNFTSNAGEHANQSPDWTDHTDQTKTIKIKGLVANSKYKFVAVGYNVDNPSINTGNPYGEPSLTDENTLEYFTTNALASGKTDYDIEELFAGVSAECVTTDKVTFSTPATVTLTRQVAGMLGYFTKVPTKIDDKVVRYINVYSNDEFTQFKWPAQLLTDDDFNGYHNEESQKSSGKYLLMKFDMAKIATNWKESAASQFDLTYKFSSFGESGAEGTEFAGSQIGSINDSKAPLAENYKAPAGLKLVENSIFGGRYIIPYAAHVSSQTMTVELQDINGDILKTLNVITQNAPSGVSEGYKQYDIRCNNFYSIGKKLYTGNTDGGDSDPDKPIDLSVSVNIEVTINDAWKVLHNMGIEE